MTGTVGQERCHTKKGRMWKETEEEVWEVIGRGVWLSDDPQKVETS